MTRGVAAAVLALAVVGCERERASPPEPAAPSSQTVAPSEPSAPPDGSDDPWEAARQRGVRFRALGQEPGWYLEIDDTSMRLVYDYGEQEAVVPAAASEIAGGVTTYTSATDAHRLHVVVEDELCFDGMSGFRFPLTVTVTIDGRDLRGCGRNLAA